MQHKSVVFLRSSRFAPLLLGLTAVASLTRCSEGPAAPAPVSDDEARAKISAIRASFPGVIAASEALSFEEDEALGARRAITPSGAARVDLPSDASGHVRIEDRETGLSARFALKGAARAPIAIADGWALYAGAAPLGGDVIHRVSRAGTEDFITFQTEPAAKEIRYDLRLGDKVAGLRLVARTLELIDGKGAPRIRVAPPVVIGADGARHEASISVAGCAFDASPRAPWGRAVTPPGAASCEVIVAWSGARVRYPALVDPSWALAKTMGIEREMPAVASIPKPGDPLSTAARPVLVTGGADKFHTILASAEIYEPLSRTFAATGSMIKARAAHTATPLQIASASGFVLVAGGGGALDPTPPEKVTLTNLTDSGSTELYNPTTGTFTLGPNMSVPRAHHTATELGDGRVLFVGGIFDLVSQPTKSADIFLFDNATPSASTIAPTGFLQSARFGHASALLPNGDVLVTGGIGSANFALLSAERYSSPSFAPVGNQLSVGRAFHTATTLSNGDVLVAGGANAIKPVSPIIYSNSADLYTGGAFQIQPILMANARAFHTATLLSPKMKLPAAGGAQISEVLLAGGFDGAADLASAEVYVPSLKAILSLPTLPLINTRRHAASALVNAGESITAGRGVVVMGGVSGSQTAGSFVNGVVTSTTEVLFKLLGDPCDSAQECLSGFCAEGVCCDTGCTEQCYTCLNANKEDVASPDGTCAPTKNDTTLPVQCFFDGTSMDFVEVHNACDGTGKTKPWDGTHSCKPNVCGQDGFCSKFCVTTADCANTGYCDLTSPPDGGAPDGGVAGTCKPQKDFSLPCTADEQCEPGEDNGTGKVRHCVDGVCCNRECIEQCQACDVPGNVGTCTNVGSPSQPEDPHPGGLITRPPCAGTVNGVKSACAGTCQGNSAVDCVYPDAMSALQTNECKDTSGGASTLTAYPCDGAGANTVVNADCGSFLCADATTCKTTCSQDADCVQDAVCIEKAGSGKECTPLTGPLCDGDHTLRQPLAMGGNVECPDHYTCPAGATACLTACESVADCVSPYVCNGQHVCTEEPSAPTELPSCSAAPARSSNDGRALLVLAGLAIGASIRLRRRYKPVS